MRRKKPVKVHKRLFFMFILLFMTVTLSFAEGSGKEWIDTSVLFMIDAFAGNTSYYILCALKLARLMMILMILWECIQMVLGTKEGKKVVIGGVTKWLFFLFILHMYPGFSFGLRKLAIEIGTGASGTSIAGLTRALGKYMDELEGQLAAAKNNDIAQFASKIQAAQGLFDQYKADYDALQKKYDDAVKAGYKPLYLKDNTAARELDQLRMKEKSAEIENLKKQQQAMIEDNESGASRTLLTLRRVLIKNNNSITSKYKLNVGLKTASGQDTGLISPNALFRIGVLAAQIMWEKEWTVIDTEIKENQENSILFTDPITNFPVRRLFDLVLTLVAALGLILVMAICLIQYIMGLIEYTITSSFAIVLIPCMLFDPLKDMSQKVLPTLLAQAVKLCFITMAMFFCSWAFLQLVTNISEQTSGFDLNTFGYVIFTGLLCAAFCVFAPKWAQTLLTGQPQMSMGEFVTATGAAVGAALKASHMVSNGKDMAKSGVQKGANTMANAAGNIAAMGGAGSAAKQAAAANGKGKFGQTMAGLRGVAQEGGSRFMGNIKEKVGDFVRGGGKGGKGGAGGERDRYSSADKTTGDVSNTRDFARHQTGIGEKDGNGNEKKRQSTFGEYIRAQIQSGRENQNVRLKRDHRKSQKL